MGGPRPRPDRARRDRLTAVRGWRICREAHVGLDGEGPRLFGGRWNSEGMAVVYASSSLALAALAPLEYLVHLDIAEAPADLIAVAFHVPDDASMESIAPIALHAGWTPPQDPGCVAIGDAWLAPGEALVLRTVADLLNPGNADACAIPLMSDQITLT